MVTSKERTNGTFIVEVTNGKANSKKYEVVFLCRLGVRGLVEAKLVTPGLHWIGDRLLANLTFLVTGREIETAVPPVREEVAVGLDVVQVIVLLEERVTDILSTAGGEQLGRLRVVIRRGQTGRHPVDVGRGGSGDGSAHADERVEDVCLDQVNDARADGVTAVGADLIEVFIQEASIVAETADEGVVLDVEVTVDTDDIAMLIAIVERTAEAEFLNGAVKNRVQVVAERIKDRSACLGRPLKALLNANGAAARPLSCLDLVYMMSP